jgi:hypothetical protein
MSEKVASELEQAEIFEWSSKFFNLEWPHLLCKTAKIVALVMLSLMAYPLLNSEGCSNSRGINLAAQETA